MLQDGGPEITKLVPSLLVQSETYYDTGFFSTSVLRLKLKSLVI